MMNTGLEKYFHLRQIYSRGITGRGITTAVLDTGIYPHADFLIPRNRICCFQDFVQGRQSSYDDNGHGTHVSGIIASAGRRQPGRRGAGSVYSGIKSARSERKWENEYHDQGH